MRLERNKWLLTVLLMASSVLWGCGSESETDDPSQRGQVSLALQSTSESGVLYGLFAEIRVQGPEDFVGFTDPFQDRFMREVQAGAYDVELLEGYALLNLETGQFEERATLVSANPVAVEVPAYGVGSLVFTFAVPGGRVSFETGTLDVGLEVVQGLPKGAYCDLDSDCASGSCLAGICDGGTEPLLRANISCELPIGLGIADADVEVTVSPRSVWTPNGSVTVDFEAIAILSAELGDLLIALGTDQIYIDSLAATMTVAGGTPAQISLTDGPLNLDVDSNDDGLAEDLRIAIAVPPLVVTHDGADSVDFSVAHFEVALSGIPILGNLVVTSAAPQSGQIGCSLSSAPVSFEVEADVGGTGGTGGVGGTGGAGGVWGTGGTGGVGGGGPVDCEELQAEQAAHYATSCVLDVAGGIGIDLTTTVYGTSHGYDLVVDEARDVTTCAAVAFPPEVVDVASSFDAEITQGDVQLTASNAGPATIFHQALLGPLVTPILTDVVTSELIAAEIGDIVITPQSATIGISLELTPGTQENLQLQIPGPECPDGFQLIDGETPVSIQAVQILR